ncbi:hypothetical protein AB0A95_30515 [Micromonospora sp. NPDC049230]|uniref:hypothetical protein n=1 Tax=Micromonospora sp. NPDC049230 TaxID=3155502 RepID=UPI0033CDA86A
MKGSDTTRARSALDGFSPAKVTAQGDALAWMERKSGGKAPAPDSAMGQYLAGGWRETNPAIRANKTPPPVVADIDAEFGELDEDVVLRRQVPLSMFAHVPIQDLEGMKVRDAAYASTSIDTPDAGPSPADAVTMHIAAAAGTPAYVNAVDGEILLARDTEIAITRAEPNGLGGWDLYGAIIPKTATKRPRAADRQDGGDTSPAPAGTSRPDGATATDGNRDDAGGDSGRGRAGNSPRAAAAPDDKPATPEDEPATPEGAPAAKTKAYQQGWDAARIYGGDALDDADERGEPDDWYDGFEDQANGRKKWQSLRYRKPSPPPAAKTPAKRVSDQERLAAMTDRELRATLSLLPTGRGDYADKIRAEMDRRRKGKKSGGSTRAGGTSAPADAGEPGPLPDDGPLGEFPRLDRERIRVAVEDHAARMFTSPMIGGSRENTARYVAEGPLTKLADRDGLARVWNAVDQVLGDRPELMTRSPEESERAAAARAERVETMASQAAQLTKDGDYAGAMDLIDQAETMAPDHLVGTGKTLRTRSWDDLRGIVRRRQETTQPAGDATPAAAAGDQLVDGVETGADLDVSDDEDGPGIVPVDGALAELPPIDRERVRIAVEDNAARIFRTPMMGGTAGNTARYVAEGRDLAPVTNRHGFKPTVNAVAQILAERPDLMTLSDEDVEAVRATRNAEAEARANAAGDAITAGDFAAARAEVDAGETAHPDFTLSLGNGPALDWAAIRRIVDEAEADAPRTPDGDRVPATAPDAPDTAPLVPAGTPVADLKNGQRAQVVGVDQYGQRISGAGYLQGDAGTVNTVKRGKVTGQKRVVQLAEYPDGLAGWRMTVYTDMDATTDADPDAPAADAPDTAAAGTSVPAAPARVPIADVKDGSYVRIAGVDIQGRKAATAGWVTSTKRIRWSPDGRTKMRNMIMVRISEHRPDTDNRLHKKVFYLEPTAVVDVPELSPPVMYRGELRPAGWLDAAEMLVTKNRGGFKVSFGDGNLQQFKSKREAEAWVAQAVETRRWWVAEEQADQARAAARGVEVIDAVDLQPGDVYRNTGTSDRWTRTVTRVEDLGNGMAMVHHKPGPDAPDDAMPFTLGRTNLQVERISSAPDAPAADAPETPAVGTSAPNAGATDPGRLDAASGGFTPPPRPDVTGRESMSVRRDRMDDVSQHLVRLDQHIKQYEQAPGLDYYSDGIRSAYDEAYADSYELAISGRTRPERVGQRLDSLMSSLRRADTLARARDRRATLTRSANPDPANNPDDAVLAIEDVLQGPDVEMPDKALLDVAAQSIESGVPIAAAADLVKNVADKQRVGAGAAAATRRLRNLHTQLAGPTTAPLLVTGLRRNEYVTVTGRQAGTTTGRTSTGYVAAVVPTGVTNEHMVTLSEYPGGHGRKELLTVYSGATVTPATPPDDQDVVLWKNARTGRPVPNPAQPDIVRGAVVRDTVREQTVRAQLDAQATETPTADPPIVLWRHARNGRPYRNPTERAIERGDVVRDTRREEALRRARASTADAGEQLAASVATGVVDEMTLGGGATATVELVTFHDGNMAVRKTAKDLPGRTGVEQQDAEELGALAMAAFGVRTPAIHRGGPTEVYAQYVEAGTGAEAWANEGPAAGLTLTDETAATDAGRLMGLADAVLGNVDRNAGNWMLDDADGTLIGIDHGDAFRWPIANPIGPQRHPVGFMRHYVTLDAELESAWGDHDISPADIAEARARLVALRPEFERLDRAGWHDNALARLDEIGAHASGERNRLAAGDEPSAPAANSTGDETPAAGTSAPAAPPQQVDIFGGVSDFVSAPRSAIGLPDRPNLGRERAIAAVQQLGLFADDRQAGMDGQMAMMDALLNIPGGDAAEPPPVPSAPDPEPTPAAPASIVPDDLSGWNDEQLGELFRAVTSDDQADEDGAARIFAEWERREEAMTALVSSVPDDLAALPEDEVAGLYARLTSELGSIDHPTVERIGADLDRRQAAEQAEAENAPRRALLARPMSELTDAEVETAATYAADLGDVAAMERVYAEWERRDAVREAAARQEQAAREAREAAERAAAVQAAQAAERAAAAAHAAAQQDRLVDAMAAAQEAAIVPDYSNSAVNNAVVVLGEDGVREVLGDAVVDDWLANLPEDSTEINRNGAMMGRAVQLPTRDRLRLVLAAGDRNGAAEFAGWSDAELTTAVSQGMFNASGPDGPRKQALGRRAGKESTRRKIQALRHENVREFRQWQIRAAAADPTRLTDAELALAPGLVTVLAAEPGEDADAMGERLDALRAEARRREAEATDRAEKLAAGPAGPARYRNPVEAYGVLRLYQTGSNPRDVAARERMRRAQAAVYGLPEDADAKAIKAAAKKDPRPVVDQAAQIMAWFRHIAEHEGVADDEHPYYRGRPDDVDVPDTPDPLPPANVAKADEVWKQILGTAQADMEAGRYETGRRVVQAIGRTYRIPVEDMEDTEADIRRYQVQNGLALSYDDRHPRVRAADFIAQYRALAADDDIDPSDTLRAGPPDKGTRRTSAAPRRPSTPEQERRIDALVAKGWDWLDAYAEVHGADSSALRSERGRAMSGGEKGIRAAYAEYVELQFRAAEAATSGYLLKKGSEGKMDARRLFSGAWSTARAHASEELLRWWGEHPRLTYADFKAQLTGGDALRGSRERLASAGEGNEFA